MWNDHRELQIHFSLMHQAKLLYKKKYVASEDFLGMTSENNSGTDLCRESISFTRPTTVFLTGSGLFTQESNATKSTPGRPFISLPVTHDPMGARGAGGGRGAIIY